MLYKRHNYLNKDIPYLISDEIIEYDMKTAGFNLIKRFNLLDDEKIKYLESLDKKIQTVQIGLYQKEDRELVRQLNEKFIEVRKWFFEANDLHDDNVLSIKKDAIITTRRCVETEFDNILFVEKNTYSSYFYLNSNEFYFNRNTLDVKGISDTVLPLHGEYMLQFLHDYFSLLEISTRRKQTQYLTEFMTLYKTRKMDAGYYRELNARSLFRLKGLYHGRTIGLTDVGDLNEIEIGYNYFRYLVPLVSVVL